MAALFSWASPLIPPLNMTLKSVSLFPVHNSSCPDALLNPWNDGNPIGVSEKCFVCVDASLIPILFLQEKL